MGPLASSKYEGQTPRGHGETIPPNLVTCNLSKPMVGTSILYRMFGMDGSEDFLYHLIFSVRPTYQWIAMTKTIIIDAQRGS